MFDTFPWPQTPTATQIDEVATAGLEVRRIRTAAAKQSQGGLRQLYRTLDLPGKNPLKDAHAALDAAVMAAHGFSAAKDILQQLLDLNRHVAAAIAAGTSATSPGVPAPYATPANLVTSDCLGP